MSIGVGGPLRLSSVVDMRVAVWGAGREGRAAAAALAAQDCRVLVVTDDGGDDAARLADDIGADHGTPADVAVFGARVVVRSPGISKYRAEVTAWESAGIGSTGLLALWLADQDPARVIGITGTKGKSTTVTLAAAVLRAGGVDAHVAGNIGVPVTELPDEGICVVEVSSYQAADCEVSPGVGVLTALGEDHVTWHGSVAQYHADKLRLFTGPGLSTLVFDGSPELRASLARVGAPTPVTGPWGLDGTALVGPSGRVDAASLTARVRQNLVLAANAAHAMVGTDASAITEAVAGFEPLPSRQRAVATVGEVRWVDDLLASNPTGVAAALESFGDAPLVLMMGGDDRAIDLSPLVRDLAAASNLVAVVLMGNDSDPIVRAVVDSGARVVRIAGHDVDAAVMAAAGLAPAGGVVSFSPGAPTPHGMGDWRDRSRMFIDAVGRLAQDR